MVHPKRFINMDTARPHEQHPKPPIASPQSKRAYGNYEKNTTIKPRTVDTHQPTTLRHDPVSRRCWYRGVEIVSRRTNNIIHFMLLVKNTNNGGDCFLSSKNAFYLSLQMPQSPRFGRAWVRETMHAKQLK